MFLAALQDTTFPVQPRNWDIPGEGDEDNPLSLETLVVFMPGLDSSFVEEFNSLPLQGLRQRILSGRVGDFFSDAPRNISYYSTNESILFTYEFPKNLSGWNHSFEQFVASGYEDFEVTNLSSSLAKVNIKKNEGEEGLYNIIFQQDIAVGTLFTVKFSKKVKRS